jgi:lysophospholipase L1-like esterase
MKTMKNFLLAFIMLWVVACANKPVRIFMAGDSTMADKPLYKTLTDSVTQETYDVENPERGWGQLLPARFNDNVEIHNHARNGRSTRSFIREGRWQTLIDSLQQGDYVIIQFGHNDQNKKKTDRYTSPEDYKGNLERFVADVREKGATPILCTPVMRRLFDTLGNFYDIHGVYPDLVREVAAAQQTLLVDLHRSTGRLLQEYGEEKSRELFIKTDNTHFNAQGATVVAALFVEELKLNYPHIALTINH